MPPSIATTFSGLPVDWVLVGLTAILLVLFTLRAGTRVAFTLALSFPVVAFVLGALSNTAFLSTLTSQLTGSAAHLGLALGVFFLVSILVFRILGSGFVRSALPLSALLSGLAATVITVVFLNQILGSNPIWHFGPQVQAIFGSAYRLWWVLGSYMVLAFARR